MKYWLAKTEPSTYSWEDLKKAENRTTSWEGIRNYQVRNLIRDEIKLNDLVFIYHSVVKPMCIAGIAKVVKESYPDFHAFDPANKYYDPTSDPDNPRWLMFDLKAIQEFDMPVTLTELKSCAPLQQMGLLQKGNRLSIQRVSPVEWQYIVGLRKVIDLK